MNMFASCTHLDEFPPGLLHDLPVLEDERNTHVEHGGAACTKPPARVLRTWRPIPADTLRLINRNIEMNTGNKQWQGKLLNGIEDTAARMAMNPTVRSRLWLLLYKILVCHDGRSITFSKKCI